jgi:hypothetical protein
MKASTLNRAVVCVWLACASVTASIAADAPVKAGTTAKDKAVDRLNLDATSITGNRELPKVMSIVPWKGAEPPGGPDRPMGSLIDEMLAPIDRDEFRREITYYRDLASPVTPVSNVPVPGANPQ